MPNPDLAQSREGNLGIITLNRPDRRNPLSLAVMLAMIGALEEFGADPGIRAVIVASTGKAFSAGHDLSEMVGRTRQRVSAYLRRLHRIDDQDSIHPAAGDRAGARRGNSSWMSVGGEL